jgi:hypothetical protein
MRSGICDIALAYWLRRLTIVDSAMPLNSLGSLGSKCDMKNLNAVVDDGLNEQSQGAGHCVGSSNSWLAWRHSAVREVCGITADWGTSDSSGGAGNVADGTLAVGIERGPGVTTKLVPGKVRK